MWTPPWAGRGHSREIARRLTTGRLICIDRDQAALDAAPGRLEGLMDRCDLVHGNFGDLADILDRLKLDNLSGVLADLGVSSPQLDDASRGFSYMADAPLDMRMDQSEALNSQNGGQRVAPGGAPAGSCSSLARSGMPPPLPRPLSAPGRRPHETTLQLVDIIRSAMPAHALREKQHPAKRSFQAIRIAVNDELSAVDRLIQAAVPALAPGGRLAIISFHSLEDRIVKNALRRHCQGLHLTPGLPGVCVREEAGHPAGE